MAAAAELSRQVSPSSSAATVSRFASRVASRCSARRLVVPCVVAAGLIGRPTASSGNPCYQVRKWCSRGAVPIELNGTCQHLNFVRQYLGVQGADLKGL